MSYRANQIQQLSIFDRSLRLTEREKEMSGEVMGKKYFPMRFFLQSMKIASVFCIPKTHPDQIPGKHHC